MTYSTINNASKKQINNQITFNNLISKRFNHTSRGWSALVIRDFDLAGLLGVIGGRINYKWLLLDYISSGRSYGIFDRLVYDGGSWSYVAGQDYVSELNTIRKILRDGK